MIRRWCVTFVLAALAPSLAAAQNTPIVSIERDGQRVGSFTPRSGPHPFEAPFPVGLFFWDQQDLHDAQGQVITGLGFWATSTGDAIRVSAYLLVPSSSSPNRYLAGAGEDAMHATRGELLATYTLTAGQSVEIGELKALGAKPVVIRVLDKPPAVTPARPSS